MEGNEKKKVSEAQMRAIANSKKKLYDRIEIYVRKDAGLKERIEAHCAEYGYKNEDGINREKATNRAAFITRAIETQMAIDRGEMKLVKVDKE